MARKNAIEQMWEQLNQEVVRNRMTNRRLTAKSEISGEAFSAPVKIFASLPLAADGMNEHAFAFCSDCRKTGETAGNGTGCLVYYDPTTDSWLNVRDDIAATT